MTNNTHISEGIMRVRYSAVDEDSYEISLAAVIELWWECNPRHNDGAEVSDIDITDAFVIFDGNPPIQSDSVLEQVKDHWKIKQELAIWWTDNVWIRPGPTPPIGYTTMDEYLDDPRRQEKG